MTIVLDSGGLSMLSANRARLAELRRRGEWPAVLPAVVLTEVLTGDHRRDFHENRLLRSCDIRPVDELLAREAAALRFKAATDSRPSAVDALVAAVADVLGGATVLTGDVGDLRALAQHTTHDVVISPV
jgi:predicted nucleic acid-binding protein